MSLQFEEKKIIYKPLEDVFSINNNFSKRKQLQKKVHKNTNIVLAAIISIMAAFDIFFEVDMVEYLLDYSELFIGFSGLLMLNYFKNLIILPNSKLNKNQKLKNFIKKNHNLIQASIFTLLFLLFVTLPSLLTVA